MVLIDPAIYSVYDEEFTTVDEPEVMHSHHAALCADRHKMAQVLRNFISNALKFTQDNSSLYILCHYIPQEKCQRYTLNKNPSATEIIRSLSSGAPIAAPSFGRCRIEVRDNGPGLEEVDALLLCVMWMVMSYRRYTYVYAILCCVTLYSFFPYVVL